ncbi:MAG: pilus assembly protein PilM [bacterium]
MAKAVIGLDFSGKKWQMVSVSAAHKKLRIQSFPRVPPSPADHKRLLQDIDEDPSLEDRIARWSFDLHQQVGPDIRQSAAVVVGMPQDLVSLRVLSFPFNHTARIAKTLPYEAEGALPFEAEDLIFDFYPIHENNGETRVFSAAARKTQVSALLERLKPLDIDPMILTPTALAYHQLARLWFTPEEMQEHRLLFVQIGDHFCHVAAVEGDRTIYAGSVNMGLYPLPAEPEHQGDEEGEAAEQVKEPPAYRPSEEELHHHQEKLADYLSRYLQRFVHFLEGYNPAGDTCPPSVARLFLLGEGASLPGLEERISSETGVDTERFSIPPEIISEETEISEERHPELAPALALALEKVNPPSQTALNFRKEEFAYQPERQALKRKILMPGVLALIFVLFFAAKLITENSIEKSRASAIQSSMVSEFKKHFPNAPAQDINKEMEEKFKSLEALETKYEKLSYPFALDCLAALSEAVPASTPVTITKLDYHGEKLVLMAETKTFEQANEITKKLQQVPFFDKVSLGDMDQKREKVSFRISIDLKQETAS